MRSNTGSKRKSRTRKPVKVLKGTLTLSLSGSKGNAFTKSYRLQRDIRGTNVDLLRIQQLTAAWLCFGGWRIWLTRDGDGWISQSEPRSNSSPKTRRVR